ncbi:IclR family transcriptional regulator C-terminal domain-containing protein [Pseudoroseomonas wenyumeiae]
MPKRISSARFSAACRPPPRMTWHRHWTGSANRASTSPEANSTERGSISIAAPVFNQTGMIAASVAVAAPASRMDEARQAVVAAALGKAVRHLSATLGHRHRF